MHKKSNDENFKNFLIPLFFDKFFAVKRLKSKCFDRVII